MSIQTTFMGKTAAQIKEHGLPDYLILYENQYVIELWHISMFRVFLLSKCVRVRYKLIPTFFPFIPYRQSFLVTRYRSNISGLCKPYITRHLHSLRELFEQQFIRSPWFFDEVGL